MSYLYLTFSIIVNVASGIFAGYFARKTADKKDASALGGFIELASVFALWGIMYGLDPSFDARVLPYSLLFAFFFALGMLGRIFAFKYGSFIIASLAIQVSSVVACIWDIVVHDDPFNLRICIGLIFVLASLALCFLNGKKAEKKTEKKTDKKNFIKWALCTLAACTGNIGAIISQREQQLSFNGQHKSMLMFFATMIAAFIGLGLYLASDKRDTKAILKTAVPFPVMSGACNVSSNFISMVLVMALPLLPTSFIYPTRSVAALIITSVFSAVAFKEKLRWWQWIGVGVGIVAVGLLS